MPRGATIPSITEIFIGPSLCYRGSVAYSVAQQQKKALAKAFEDSTPGPLQTRSPACFRQPAGLTRGQQFTEPPSCLLPRRSRLMEPRQLVNSHAASAGDIDR